MLKSYGEKTTTISAVGAAGALGGNNPLYSNFKPAGSAVYICALYITQAIFSTKSFNKELNRHDSSQNPPSNLTFFF